MSEQPRQIDSAQADKLLRALQASSEQLFQIILSPEPEVLLAALKNRALQEDHLVTLLKRKDLPEEIPERIFQRSRKSLSHKLLLALVKNPVTNESIFRTLLPQLHLFELLDLCCLPGATADRRLAAERNILQRLPTTPLGSKLSLARRASANIVAELLKEGQPQLTEACLGSSRLKEVAIFQFLGSSRASAETISQVARHQRWNQRPNLRLAILKNARTPAIWFQLWLPRLSLPLLKQLASAHKNNPRQTRLLTDELQRRTKV